jgi:hypothetical protein
MLFCLWEFLSIGVRGWGLQLHKNMKNSKLLVSCVYDDITLKYGLMLYLQTCSAFSGDLDHAAVSGFILDNIYNAIIQFFRKNFIFT